MDVGMLWYDDDARRGIEEKVSRAAAHYKDKYGQMPTLCFVNPATLNGGPDVAAGVQIKASRTVLPHHFWIGLADPTTRVPANGSNGTNGAAKKVRRVKAKGTEGRGEVKEYA